MKIQILDYQSKLQPYFQQLNEDWLTKYFEIEAIDKQVLEKPQQNILDVGGKIWFSAIEENGQLKVIGCAAVLPNHNNQLELTKMAVNKQYRGIKAGQKLVEHAIQYYQESGYDQLFLESNAKLTPALKLYEKLGFKHYPAKVNSHYKRADVYMVFQPN